ncbi:MAG: ABC transporter substrate-binding protein [Bacteroidales bacterium]|nr:ABC transporter substrate-binding protein [Bacteroidales bacterium]
MKKIVAICIFFIISSCFSPKEENIKKGEQIEFKYATYLKINKLDDCYEVNIRNPWDTTKLLRKYYFVNKNIENQYNFSDGTIVKIPLEKSLIYTSVHSSLVYDLGAESQIGSICDTEYVKNKNVKNLLQSGKIKNAGSATNPNIEKFITLKPDAILLCPFENSGYGLVEKLNIPIIECADYMEVSPLAQAEWIKFFGILYGKENIADSLFQETERKYLEIKMLAQKSNYHPTLISELKTGSAWYVSGGQSTMGQFYIDAGFDYIFKNVAKTGAIPLSIEQVFEKGENADFWLFKYYNTNDLNYNDLNVQNDFYKNFKAFQKHNIYCCNTNKCDFFDEIEFHPELLLKDLVKIKNPELFQDYNLKYFKALEN